MSKLTLTLSGTAAAIALAAVFAAPAHAAPTKFLYFGGATFPERQYRDLMNCYGDHSGTDTETGLTSHICSTGDLGFVAPYRPDVQVLYAGVGSGNGKKGWWNHDAGDIIAGFTDGARIPDSIPVPSTTDDGPRYGTAVGALWAATKSTANPFPSVTGAGSDDPLLVTDLTDVGKYNANSAINNWGPAIQVPTFVGAVGIGYNPASGAGITWTEKGKKPAGPVGAYSLVSLKTDTWCGIMTGAITDWNDAAITADNGGKYITTGTTTIGPAAPITVVYRSDGSGTTFIFANAFLAQCNASANPVPDTWETADPVGSGINVIGVSNNNWFLNVGAAGFLPANFIGKPGNGGIHDHVVATAGAVGYMSTDFLQPVDPSGPKATNLQTFFSFTNALAPVFKQPNAKSAAAIMSALPAPLFTLASCTTDGTYNIGTSPDGICAHNPMNWGAVNPTPLSTAAFPIGGFTFAFLYSCYDPAGSTNIDSLIGKTAGSFGFLQWYYGAPTVNFSMVKNSLAKNGFSPVPGKWLSGTKKLLFTDKKTKIGSPGQANTACSTLAASGGA